MPNTRRAVTFSRKKRITEVHFCRDYKKNNMLLQKRLCRIYTTFLMVADPGIEPEFQP